MKNRMTFEQLQEDLTVDPVGILWGGDWVELRDMGSRTMARFSTKNPGPCGDGLVQKIKDWCMKNTYRCPQIRNGRIRL